MNILLLGSGGREHALAWKIAQSAKCSKLFIAPGNAGTEAVGENVAIAVDDFDNLKNFAVEKKVDMIVVGPEDPLVKGVYDIFKEDERTACISVIGPSKAGAVLEGSKDFAKSFMKRHHIPTAAYETFDGKPARSRGCVPQCGGDSRGAPPGGGARAGGSAKRWLPHIFHPSFHDRQFEEWRNDAIPRTS